MLRRLFGAAAKVLPGKVPEGQAAYAIGDVHGRLDLLEALLSCIAEDARRHEADQARSLVQGLGRTRRFAGAGFLQRGNHTPPLTVASARRDRAPNVVVEAHQADGVALSKE